MIKLYAPVASVDCVKPKFHYAIQLLLRLLASWTA